MTAEEEPAAAKPKSGCGTVLLVVIGLALALAIYGAVRGGSDDEPDAGAKLACRHFRNVARDFSDGVLTVPEFRDKLKEVDDDASVSEEPGIASGARRMLAAVTAMDDAELADAVTDFGDACAAADL